MDLIQNDLIKRILELLRDESVQCYITGGYIREWLLGQPGKDLDLTVVGSAIPLARRIANETGGAFYILDEKTDAGRVVYRDPIDLVVDVAAARGADILADLRERDFSINAMAVDIRCAHDAAPPLLDPCGGRRDLAARILRATSEHAFRSDPVRLLRGVRFAVTLNLTIEPQTESWLRRDALLITQPSAERIRQELMLIIAAQGAADHLRRLDDLELLGHVIPELMPLKGVQQSEPHVNDVYEHSLDTVAQAERLAAFPNAQLSLEEAHYLGPFAAQLAAHFGATVCENRTRYTLLKLAALLHDVGKPATCSVEPDGRVRFFSHEHLSAQITVEVLTRLRFSAQEVRLVSATVAQHMRPGFLIKEGPVSRRAIYHFFRDSGDASVDALMLSLADHLATRGAMLLLDHWRTHLEFVNLLLDNYYHRPAEAVSPPPLVTGRDVMKLLSISSGPQVGQLLEAVREAQVEGLVRTREEALQFLREQGLSVDPKST